MAIMKRRKRPGPVETTVSLALMVCLGLVAIAVWQKQFHYNESIFHIDFSSQTAEHKERSQPIDQDLCGIPLADLITTNTAPLSSREEFGRENLSDKIDGRAELYLELGFVKLFCQRFAVEKAADQWFEVFAYDMGNPTNAFAVYSAQRRAGAAVPEIGPLAYATGNAVFFVSGKYYVEVIGATDAESLQSAMRALAISFARRLPTEKGDLEAVNYLPKEGLRPETIKLILKDAFGYDKLDRVITADYSVEGTTVTLFVSKRASPAESAQLAQAYYQFLKDDMGADALTAKQASRLPSGVFGVSALGQFELVGSHGPILYGVHASPSFEAGCRVLEAFLKTTESTQP
ncbi:MAG: hypothetical protein KatS3mg130_0036 [Candidatus Sumerlaea sp.]|nr:MAG: hypothetical protein KatS3mg130_0036 [Candidatus Sumerlaea sp.]